MVVPRNRILLGAVVLVPKPTRLPMGVLTTPKLPGCGCSPSDVTSIIALLSKVVVVDVDCGDKQSCSG